MNQFSSGLELANLVGSLDLLHYSWDAIVNLQRRSNSEDPNFAISVKCHVYPHPCNGTIAAFITSPTYTVHHLQGEGGEFVSSEALRGGSFPLFDFISTKVNPSFSIHRAAISLFSSHQDELSLLKDQLCVLLQLGKPVILTGHSLGGSIASLFTLWLLDSISPQATKRPLCITFGSPLLGDSGFQGAVLERRKWNSCFLHVVSNQDPVPKFLISAFNVPSAHSASPIITYKPFGSYLLCSDSGFACFEEPESILQLLLALGLDSVDSPDPDTSMQIFGETLQYLRNKAICRGISSMGDLFINPLRAGIILQLKTIGVIKSQQQQENNEVKALITKIERENIHMRKKHRFDPSKKLNDVKINMAYLEWYKKTRVDEGGYYDSYKDAHRRTGNEIRTRGKTAKFKEELSLYWKKMVEEVKQMPQKEGASFRTRWLYAGTNYRRMVEPLDIAEYYNQGKKDYLNQERSEHYVLLEQWMIDDKSAVKPGNVKERNAAASLTEDSCFWAHVEEAKISCGVLKDMTSSPENRKSAMENLIKFESYMKDSIENYAVSPEIFVPNSSFMQWWSDYKILQGTSYDSWMVDFMNNRYKLYA